MSRKKTTQNTQKMPIAAGIIIFILLLVLMINGVSIIYKYATGYRSSYKPQTYDAYSINQERFADAGDTYQRNRYKGSDKDLEAKGSLAVGQYYYYSIINKAHRYSGDEQSQAYYGSILDKARANVGEFASAVSRIDELLDEAVDGVRE